MSLPRLLAGDSRVYLRCPQLGQKEREAHPVSDSSSGTLSWSLHEDTWTQMKLCRPSQKGAGTGASYSESWCRAPEHDVTEMGPISEWQAQEVALSLPSTPVLPPSLPDTLSSPAPTVHPAWLVSLLQAHQLRL